MNELKPGDVVAYHKARGVVVSGCTHVAHGDQRLVPHIHLASGIDGRSSYLPLVAFKRLRKLAVIDPDDRDTAAAVLRDGYGYTPEEEWVTRFLAAVRKVLIDHEPPTEEPTKLGAIVTAKSKGSPSYVGKWIRWSNAFGSAWINTRHGVTRAWSELVDPQPWEPTQ